MIEYIKSLVARADDERGQTMAEYAVVLGVITVAVIVALTFLSGSITSELSNIANTL
jgi:Flp pilus assembly pilin Flp